MDERKKILFVSHPTTQCGVYEFGKNISDVLLQSTIYNFIRVECGGLQELYENINKYNPFAIIYNYHPATMSRLTKKIVPHIIYKNRIYDIQIPQIGIIHEVTRNIVDNASKKKKLYIGGLQNQFFGTHKGLINQLFDYYIAPDPTIRSTIRNVYKTGRLIQPYNNTYDLPEIPTIGSFGFGTANKGFEKIIQIVQEEFENAIIRINIPFADYGDKNGEHAASISKRCRSLIKKEGIRLIITHSFFSKTELLDFLAQNTINIFLYQNPPGEARGISSVIEHALAVQRPICISKSSMFRHISQAKPSVCIEDNTIKQIIANGFEPLVGYYKQWQSEIIMKQYEEIIDSIVLK